MVQYESVIRETLGHYDLTPKQVDALVIKIDREARCPWFFKHAYLRAHTEGSYASLTTVDK